MSFFLPIDHFINGRKFWLVKEICLVLQGIKILFYNPTVPLKVLNFFFSSLNNVVNYHHVRSHLTCFKYVNASIRKRKIIYYVVPLINVAISFFLMKCHCLCFYLSYMHVVMGTVSKCKNFSLMLSLSECTAIQIKYNVWVLTIH